MKIILQNFRKHKYLEIELEDNKIILIKGESGTGKTTIFNAIRWCLYGDLKKIYPKTEEKNKKIITSVHIIYKNFSIKRTKDSLSFLYGKVEYTDVIAQAQINLYFGDFKIWYNCNYSEQEYRNILISGTESEKIELLNLLSFNDCNPEQVISKISENIKICKFESIICKESLNKITTEYNNFLTQYNGKFDQNSFLNQTQITELQSALSQTKTQLTQYDLQKISNDTSKNMYTHLTEQKNVLLQKLEELKSEIDIQFLQNQIVQNNELLQKYKQYIQNKPLYTQSLILKNQYITQLQELQNCVDPIILYEKIKTATNLISLKNNSIYELENELNRYNRINVLIQKLQQIPEIPNLERIQIQITEAKKLQQLHYINDQNIIAKNNILQQIIDIKTQLSQKTDLQILKTEIQTLTGYLQYEQIYNMNKNNGIKITEINTELQKIDNHTNYLTYTLSKTECVELESLNLEYLQNLKLCQSVNLSFTDVNSEIQKLEKLLADIPLINQKKELLLLQNEYLKYSSFNVSENEVLEFQKYLNILKNSLDVLICPNCKTCLRLNDKTLNIANSVKSTIQDVQAAEINFTQLTQNFENTKIKNSLLFKLQTPIPDVQIVEYNLDEIYRKLQILKSIKIVSKPEFDIQFIHTYLKVKDLYAQLQTYTSNYNPDLQNIDFENIKNSIVKTQNELQIVQALNNQLEALDLNLKNITITQLPKLEIDIVQMEQKVQEYKILESNKNNYIQELQNMQYTANISEQIDILTSKIKNLKFEISETNLQTLNLEYENNNINYNKKLEIIKKLEIENSKIFEFDHTLTDVNEENIKKLEDTIIQLQNKIKSHEQSVILTETHTKQIIDLENQISEIKIDYTLDNLIESTKNEYTENTVKLEKAEICNNFYKLYSELSNLTNKNIELEQRQINLYQLETVAKDTERYCLESTIDDINNKLNQICSELFDSKFQVQLNLYKTLKNGNIKSSVTVDIMQAGIIYTVDEISPGEKDRISLALLIALSYYGSSPFLMLDETMKSLSANDREKCFESIKNNTGKTVINIQHMEVEGFYDQVIELK